MSRFVDGAGKHLLVYFNTAPDCGGVAGLATLGGGPSGGDLAGGGRVWSNGYDTVGVLGHDSATTSASGTRGSCAAAPPSMGA